EGQAGGEEEGVVRHAVSSLWATPTIVERARYLCEPITEPVADTPRRSNTNTSCRFTVAPIWPVISEMPVIRRWPSLKRATCTMMWIARLIIVLTISAADA